MEKEILQPQIHFLLRLYPLCLLEAISISALLRWIVKMCTTGLPLLLTNGLSSILESHPKFERKYTDLISVKAMWKNWKWLNTPVVPATQVGRSRERKSLKLAWATQ
jgi:hypothetical protein